jgi:glucosamine 6-phosphate synthetase-like amidotransferase/phosphosugar isomerase protein
VVAFLRRCLPVVNRAVVAVSYGEPIALEGALKIKECAYLHAEGYSGGALKHGPFALIEDTKGSHGATPIICIILDDEYANQMRIVGEEVKARGAKARSSPRSPPPPGARAHTLCVSSSST